MNNMNLHHVTSIEIESVDTNETTAGPYSTRKIIVKTEKGFEFELVLFAELPKFLEVAL